MKLIVISGGPGTGKTTLIKELYSLGYFVLEESARKIANNDERFLQKSTREINMHDFQHAIFQHQKKVLENLYEDSFDIVFSDRWFGDTLAFMRHHNIEIPNDYLGYAKNFPPKSVFMLNPLNFYKKDRLRQESREEMKKIHEGVINMYGELKQKIVFVPFSGIKDRLDFILENIQNL